MKNCPFCNQQIADDAVFCTHCGKSLQNNAGEQPNQQPNQQYAQPQYNQQVQYVQPAAAPSDHTAEFSPEDVHDHKMLALLIYCSSIIGIIIALISQASGKSEYLAFHIKQGLKLIITEVIVSVITVVLFWTCIVPIAGAVALIIILIADIICFIQTCRNKSVEPIVVRSLGFLN